jgi:hypothetical protein
MEGHSPGVAGIVHSSIWLAAGCNVKTGVEFFDCISERATLDSCCYRVQRIVVYLAPASKGVGDCRGGTQCRACEGE